MASSVSGTSTVPFLRLTPPQQLHFENIDKTTLSFMSEATAQNVAEGNIEGIGWNPNDNGLSHRNHSIKDREFFEKHGEYPECHTLLIA